MKERTIERREKFALLVNQLRRLSEDQGSKTEINAYDEMEIIVVKSASAEGINLISETIEALKANADADRTSRMNRGLFGGSEKPAEKPGAH